MALADKMIRGNVYLADEDFIDIYEKLERELKATRQVAHALMLRGDSSISTAETIEDDMRRLDKLVQKQLEARYGDEEKS